MYINENRLNNIIDKNINKYILEAWGNQGFGNQGFDANNQNTEFTQDTVDTNRKNRPANTSTQLLKGAGKGVATYVGAGLGAGVVGTMLGMSAGAMTVMSGVFAALGVGALVANLAGNIIALKKAQKLKFPKSPYNAMEYARFAAAERTEAQDMCRKLQENIQNAIAAYNQKFDKELDTTDMSVFGNETAEFQDRGQTQQVNVDWDRDFSNINAGQNESRIYEAFNSAEELNKQTKTVDAQNYLNQFQQMQEPQALQVIQELKDKYKEAYGLWMQWTRYINVLVHAFKNYGLTWEAVINSNKNTDTKSLIKSFIKQKLNIVDSDDVNSYQPNTKNATYSQLSVRIKSLDYPISNGGNNNNVQYYVLLKDVKNGTFYAIPKFTEIKNGQNGTVPIQKEMPLTLSLKPMSIVGQKRSQDGKTIKLLNQNAAHMLTLMKKGNQIQTI